MTNWLTVYAVAYICNCGTQWVEYHRRCGRIAARKEVRTVESCNSRGFVSYKKHIWVYNLEDARSLREAQEARREKRRRKRGVVSHD